MKSSSEASTTTLRMIEFLNIPKAAGDVVVLLVAHPGLNMLGRFFPSSRVNELLLAEMSRVTTSTSHGDAKLSSMDEEVPPVDEVEAIDTMDLASFLECAIC